MDSQNQKDGLKGIVNFWDLPTHVHVILDSEFKAKLMKKFMEVTKTKYNANKITGISRPTIGRYINKKDLKIRIEFLLKIVDVVNNYEFSLDNAERNITWVGGVNSQGIINPSLPFNFNSRSGARFLAAICNEGWISDGAYYSNSEQELRDSVKKDTLSIFGGDENTVRDWVKEKDQYLAFPSIIRDVLILITGFKGVKSENNPPVPSFILRDKELIFGWIEQTIADEGNVRYYPETYRREIIWTRSFNKNLRDYKLIRDELKMLNILGINYDLKNYFDYQTKKGIEKTRLHIRISKRKNLLKLRKIIKIPCKRKDETFTLMMKYFVRYKEPLRVKDTIISLCKNKGYVTSSELRKEMNYKNVTNAVKWISLYFNQGLLKCIKKTSYGNGGIGRIPARYTLTKP